MKEAKILRLDDEDGAFVKDLEGLGIEKHVAKAITFLTNVNSATTRDIERATDMRQPEVSKAIKIMRRNKWLDSWNVKNARTGRMVYRYMLIPIGQILNQLEKTKREGHEKGDNRHQKAKRDM